MTQFKPSCAVQRAACQLWWDHLGHLKDFKNHANLWKSSLGVKECSSKISSQTDIKRRRGAQNSQMTCSPILPKGTVGRLLTMSATLGKNSLFFWTSNVFFVQISMPNHVSHSNTIDPTLRTLPNPSNIKFWPFGSKSLHFGPSSRKNGYDHFPHFPMKLVGCSSQRPRSGNWAADWILTDCK